jgi:putative pyoverdin transport system ATP-binding/permease protein
VSATRNPAAVDLGNRLLSFLRSARRETADGTSGFRPASLNFFTRSRRLVNERQLIASIILSGVSGTCIVMILNAAVRSSPTGHVRLDLLLGFLAFLVLFRITQTSLLSSVSEAVENSLHEMRTRIAGKFIQLDLADVESLPHNPLVQAVALQCSNISNAILPLVGSLQSAVLLVLMFGYLFYISPLAALMTLVLGGQVGYSFVSRLNVQNAAMAQSARQNTALSYALNEYSSGFKELRLDREKRMALNEDLETYSASAATANIESTAINTDLLIIATSAAYLLGAVAVFLLPVFGSSDNISSRAVLTVILFMMGPLAGCAGALQQVAVVRFATEQLDAFEGRLDSLLEKTEFRAIPTFERIDIEGISYEHVAQDHTDRFAVGPISLNFRPGTITFLTGGNGSGKTTALRMVTGLYPHSSGRIRLNGRCVEESELDSYRQLFGAVFADVHVFSRPYAMNSEQLRVLDDCLTYLRIRHKLPVQLADGYDPERLSTGERKRLALAIAMAEGRPILVFDELAADQDPHFREMFYREILQRLRAEGRAVFAITHDDRFFGTADVRYHMEEGKMSLIGEE